MRLKRSLLLGILGLSLLAVPTSASAYDRGGTVDDMLTSVNQVRAKHGLRALRPTSRLLHSSQGYSTQLMRQDSFGHSGLSRARSGSFSRLGEALEIHSGRKASPNRALRYLMNSPPHRALLMSRTMTQIGAGVTRGRFRGSRAVIWVVHVGRG